MRAAVFGGSGFSESSPEYAASLEVGRILASHGFEVVSGGYTGVMDAVSKGAKAAGGKATGVLCRLIDNTGFVKQSKHLTSTIKTNDLFDRLRSSCTGMDLFVVMPGGSGTLTELMLTCDLMALGSISSRPILVVGNYWKAVMDHIESGSNKKKKLDTIHFIESPDAMAQFLEAMKHG